MAISRSKCVTNQRCEICPIERLPDEDARRWAAEIVGASRQTLNVELSAPTLVTFGTMVHTVEYYADGFDKPELTGAVVGALAISMAGQCKLEEI